MDYKKPQRTLVQGGVGLYPLTTADQVILADGSRLEKDGKINADSAADSAKLGGKAPEYYLQPRNLLDNSDFRNPVNQRGEASYPNRGYTIDRWYTPEARTIDLVEGGIKIGQADIIGGLSQKIENCTPGDVFTFAVQDANGNTYVKAGPLTENTEDWLDTGNGIKLRAISIAGNGIFSIANDNINNVFVWASLYEGSYTADTLPPYVPKGYAVELAECMRYYQKFQMLAGTGANTSQRVFVILPVAMRITPTIDCELVSGAQPNNVVAQARNVIDVTGADSYSHLSISLSADL